MELHAYVACCAGLQTSAYFATQVGVRSSERWQNRLARPSATVPGPFEANTRTRRFPSLGTRWYPKGVETAPAEDGWGGQGQTVREQSEVVAAEIKAYRDCVRV